MAPPQSRQSRRLLAGFMLIAAPFCAVMVARGFQQPWIAAAPEFRQEGPQNAKAVLVEFSDFECPACGAAMPAVKNLREYYGANLRVVFKHFPWDFHPYAKKAAVAAECAGRQGKFWEMHDLLFQNQRSWPERERDETPDQAAAREKKAGGMIAAYAGQIRVKQPDFNTCLQDPSIAAAVEADQHEGKEHWVHSTPTFFINGVRFVGANQLRTLGMNAIDRIVKKS